MPQNTKMDLNRSSIAKGRLYLIITTVGVVVMLSAFLFSVFNPSETSDIPMLILSTLTGLFGIGVLISGVFLQAQMCIRKPIIILTALLAFFIPYLTGISLILMASIELKHNTNQPD